MLFPWNWGSRFYPREEPGTEIINKVRDKWGPHGYRSAKSGDLVGSVFWCICNRWPERDEGQWTLQVCGGHQIHRILAGLRVKHVQQGGKEAESNGERERKKGKEGGWGREREIDYRSVLWTRSRCAKCKVMNEEVQPGVIKPGSGCVGCVKT